MSNLIACEIAFNFGQGGRTNSILAQNYEKAHNAASRGPDQTSVLLKQDALRFEPLLGKTC